MRNEDSNKNIKIHMNKEFTSYNQTNSCGLFDLIVLSIDCHQRTENLTVPYQLLLTFKTGIPADYFLL